MYKERRKPQIREGLGECPLAQIPKTTLSIPVKDGTDMVKLLATPAGALPDPSEYLDKSYIEAHLDKFDEGGSYLVLAKYLDDPPDGYGRDFVGDPDGVFMMPKSEMDELLEQLEQANGDMSIIETALGFKPGSLRGEKLIRIDVPNPKEQGLRMPSGNEPGASELWLPGGKTSGGRSEAVTNAIPKGSYTESPVN